MSMFWGLCMKPNRKYTQTIVKSFHISGVALDDGSSAKLYITADKNKYIVATLNKAMPQVPLDLNFCKGDKIMFQTTGDANVSLIGYLHDSDLSDDEDYDDDEYAALAEKLQKKGASKGAENDSDDDEEASDEEEEDDDKLAAEYSSFLEGEESGEEEEDDSEDDDEDGEEEEEEESDEEDTPKAKKAKIAENAKKPAKEQNGVSKGEQKQQQQQKSKKDKKAAGPEAKKEQPKAKENKQQPAGERTIAGGVKVQDLSAGNGPEAKQGKRVSVYYTGRLKSNNKTFDSMQKGNGFKFALGGGEVIKGWDVGVVGMKVGGKRRLTCPAHMAYGARGHPPTIPPNATLVFDVELKAVH